MSGVEAAPALPLPFFAVFAVAGGSVARMNLAIRPRFGVRIGDGCTLRNRLIGTFGACASREGFFNNLLACTYEC